MWRDMNLDIAAISLLGVFAIAAVVILVVLGVVPKASVAARPNKVFWIAICVIVALSASRYLWSFLNL